MYEANAKPCGGGGTTLALLFRNVKFCIVKMFRKKFIRNTNKSRIYNYKINLYSEIAENSVIIKKYLALWQVISNN